MLLEDEAGLQELFRRARSPQRDLTGWAILSVCVGLFLHALAGIASRHEHWYATPLFWISLIIIFVPCAFRIVGRDTVRRERITLSLVLAAAAVFSQVVLYPKFFVYHDELVHVEALRLLTSTHRLFHATSTLPVVRYYPGLEIVTHAVSSLTGLTGHTSGVIVLVLARVLSTLALIAFVEWLTGSERVAAIAALVYAANPQYLFFNSQFSYQSLALPLALAAVYLLVDRSHPRHRRAVLPAIAIGGAAIVSHHLMGLAFVGAVFVLWRVERVARGYNRESHLYGIVAAAATAMLGLYTLFPGTIVMRYVGSALKGSGEQINAFITGSSNHKLFVDGGGSTAALWERIWSVSSLALIGLLLLPALWKGRAWFKRRDSRAIALLVTAAAFPLLPIGHLTLATSEFADRSTGLIFVGVGFALAWWAGVVLLHRTRDWTVAITLVLTFMFVGGVLTGFGPSWLRMPGPYLVSADNRTVDRYNVATAEWIGQHLPPNSRVLSDRIGRLLAAAIGTSYSVTHVGDNIDASRVFFDHSPTPNDLALIRKGRIQYLVVDVRMSTGLPHVGVYLEQGEDASYAHKFPVTRVALTKFDNIPGVARIYDNGAVIVYDIRGINASS